jgi:hypothetical protein
MTPVGSACTDRWSATTSNNVAKQPAVGAATDWTVHLQGAGPIRFGMSLAEARQATGNVLRGGQGAVGCAYVVPPEMPPGMDFMVENVEGCSWRRSGPLRIRLVAARRGRERSGQVTVTVRGGDLRWRLAGIVGPSWVGSGGQ